MRAHRYSGHTLFERFWMKVRKTRTCWLWTGATHDAGYGIIGKGDRFAGNARAHVLSYEWHVGRPVPKGMFVCHKCDNPACVNPKHLFLGTAKDNHNDMRKKGRNVDPPKMIGLANVNAVPIKFRGRTMCLAAWSRETGLNRATIRRRLRLGLPMREVLCR